MARKQQKSTRPHPEPHFPAVPGSVRVIGGEFRGRKLRYSGDERTRPMKDRVREAIFNLLGQSVKGTLAIDLFAGTGALGFEALSRGAARALLIERHFPTLAIIRDNARILNAEGRAEIVGGDAFYWAERLPAPADIRWTVFISPPFDLYVTAQPQMLALIAALVERSPPESQIVVESDERFDLALLPDAGRWDVRPYPPAVVSIYRKTGS